MAGWAQYPHYGTYQAVNPGHPGNPGQGVHPNPAIYHPVTPSPAQMTYPGHSSRPFQGGNFYAGGGYNTQGTFAPQQYHEAPYPQQQFGHPQPAWPSVPGYPQQSYSHPMPAQPAFPTYPQYQQQVSTPQPQQSFHQQPLPPPAPQSSQQQSFKPKAAKPSLDTCYNCGSPEHWAMNCPEPKRSIPFGASFEGASAQDVQKGKHRPAIITRYAVPPHVAAQHGTPITPQPLQTPITPQFGAHHIQPWQSTQPQTQYPQNVHYPSHQLGATQQSYGLPTPRNSFSLTSTPQAGPNSPQHQIHLSNHPTQDQNNFQPPHVYDSPLHSASRAQIETSNDPTGQVIIDHHRKASMDQSVSMLSNTDDDDDDDDDLQLLDIGDLPYGFDLDDFPKPKPVGIPIPALDTEEPEDGSSSANLPRNPADQIVSKYHENDNEAILLINISDTQPFADLRHDPAFAQIVFEDSSLADEVSRTSPSSYSNKISDSSTLATDTSLAPHTQIDDNGNRTPVYRQELDSTVRPRDAFDLDSDDFAYQEPLERFQDVQTTAQSSSLNHIPYHPPPPPPPPPPVRHIPGSTTRCSRNEHSNHNGHQTSGHHSASQRHRSSCSDSLRSPGHSLARKRKAEAVDFMEPSERDRKRQEDESSHKYKRNPPKVAEAYSRRW